MEPSYVRSLTEQVEACAEQCQIKQQFRNTIVIPPAATATVATATGNDILIFTIFARTTASDISTAARIRRYSASDIIVVVLKISAESALEPIGTSL